MCDYHSISVNRRGDIAHTANNSHSMAVKNAKWIENTKERTYHWDFEYDPNNMKYPGALECMTGEGYVSKPTQRVLDSVDMHYERLANLHNDNISILPYFSTNKYADVRKTIAFNSTTSPEMLAQLSKDESWNIRYLVATNPHTPPFTLSSLSIDRIVVVRYRVALNPSTPSEAIKELSKDECVTIKTAAQLTLTSSQNED